MLSFEFSKLEPGVRFYCASPGHCRTELNGFSGKRDPLEGAGVVVELCDAEEGVYGDGFWELEEGVVRRVPW